MKTNLRLLTTVLVTTGVLLGLTSTFAMYVLNDRRNEKLRAVIATEAWSRYTTAYQACVRGNVLRIRVNALTDESEGERIALVVCSVVIPRPTVPKPQSEETP